jgi:amidase
VTVRVVSDSEPRWAARTSDTPVASIDAGEEFEVTTLDCRAGTIRSHHDLGRVADATHINPITGPIEIRGARANSVLSLEITAIQGRNQPLMLVRPGVTTFGFVDRTALEFPRIVDDSLHVCGLRIPMEPMVGFVATTPATDALASSDCGPTGGNLDARVVTAGAEVLLPVETDGAGLFLGDVHLAQGDGELFLTGVESSAVVRVVATPLADLQIPGPVIIGDGVVSVIGDGRTLDEAASVAANRTVALLHGAFGLSEYDVGFILSAGAHLRVCRYLPNYGSVCRIEIPQRVLNQIRSSTETGAWLTRGS